ncbi:MAG: hypothetical protein A2Z42_02165 [Candidatus Woykebacteria bacterium RBG_19FT_COMBO_43_10]|uniref:NodB homology domain-containing protein n=1 Tax=Candidatus Woykebacteria bacterium RBG_19FT_COMBO_43_10 TaxID=1802598 RepID=A0A1G1WJD9_9BACT|nr:MAG: hypothetical protein A2Z42_02165 [Candidatus Woykebacteria bacterium RBG_19FT_COMBO_43_10]
MFQTIGHCTLTASKGGEMNKKTITIAVVLVAFVTTAFMLVGFPYFFRIPLESQKLDYDKQEKGKVVLDSNLVVEFRGDPGWVEFDPPIGAREFLEDRESTREEIAWFPWHEGRSWSKVRYSLNPNRKEIFKPETKYTIKFRNGEKISFETITLPKVVDVYKSNMPPRDFGNIATFNSVLLVFNEEIAWQDDYLIIDPPAAVSTDSQTYSDGRWELFVMPEKRWENSTTYTLTIKQGLKDTFGHPMEEDYSLTFTTEPPVSVVEATPEGTSQSIDSVVKIVFDRAPVPKAGESSFVVTPGVEGKMTWEDETTFVWTPAQKLPYSTEYVLAIGGNESWQDPITAHEWKFRTQDPPVSVEIESRSSSPTTLKVIASGGLSSYSYEWSTGETSEFITAKVPAGETRSFSVTVTSGDQTAAAEILVKGPPLPPPPPTPAPVPPAPASAGGMKFVLSFDDSDGSGGVVSGILDVLAAYGAKAIFFPTGSWAHGAGAPYISRMLAEGHMVCNHTRDHANLTFLSEVGIREQILGGAGVGTCNLLRPPYGSHNAFVDSAAASMGYSIYTWTVDPRDWSGTSVSYITSTILSNASPGGIVVLHMHAGNTLIALPAIIEGLQAAGYTLSY